MAKVLLVCTGNICRSPMAEGFLSVRIEERFGYAALLVASAGVVGRDGGSPMPESVHAAAERGVDISGHVVRRLLVDHIEAADLVLAMACEHRDEILRALPVAAPKLFTLKELVRLLETLPPVEAAAQPDRALATRVAAADELRRKGFETNPLDEDVADPLGMPYEAFRAIAWELDEWCSRLAEGLFGRAPARAGAAGE